MQLKRKRFCVNQDPFALYTKILGESGAYRTRIPPCVKDLMLGGKIREM